MNGLQGMEAEYQAYKDYVNFVWLYGREAHPDDKQLWESHGYDPALDLAEGDNTTTMEERAYRAYQLKYGIEPNLGIPMIIDYINTSLGADDDIRNTYGAANVGPPDSGNPNAGYIIDCDGTVLLVEDWAWTQGGGMSAPTSEDLEAYLNAYLADPSPCYTGATDLDVDADTDADADPDCTEEPKIRDNTHTGWKIPDCAQCHAMPPNICHTATSPPECAECHGGNGAACPPAVAEDDEPAHTQTDPCQSCHSLQHGFEFADDSSCAACHYASSGVEECDEEDDDDADGGSDKGACGCENVGSNETHPANLTQILVSIF